ncbi:DUF6011 domain-containing protein [Bacillus paranthracis]|uniref:DUF6011 domain-containing protein n=1 Tax=Bacillus paranthracis TaxID=2026186 RepID=UPI0021FAEF50|nr:DUF6011 domain-containing protein [Bacillus paranthracis]UXR28834.1 hypothetical protein [Bacillus phage Nachito]
MTVIEKVKEYRITVRQFLTKSQSNPVPLRTMFGVIERESERAYYVKLQGKPEPASSCLHCGRQITNPVSLLYGIGPVCGGHFHMNPLKSEADLDAFVAELREKMSKVKFEGWLPKAHIEVEETGDYIEVDSTPKKKPVPKKEVDKTEGYKLEITDDLIGQLTRELHESLS